MQSLFWVCVVGASYSYFIYPALLMLLVAFRRGAPGVAAPPIRSMSMIVAARNEAAKIRRKLDDSLALEPPGVPLEIIVASDASDDGTDTIVQDYEACGVRLSRTEVRLGKENAQAQAIQKSTGDILVFTDAGTTLAPDALRRVAAAFTTADVGAISSEDRFISVDGGVAGEGMYVRYEMWLRKIESRAAGLVGLSGSFFAARREVCAPWDIHSPSDFNTAINCARSGVRAVSAPAVFGFYRDLKDSRSEYRRKTRTVLRGITAVARHPDVLNPFRFGLFSWQVWSHKIMRWSVPFFLIMLFAVTAALAPDSMFHAAALGAQVAFYATAALTHFIPGLRELALPRLVYFFVQVNIAIIDALFRFAAGRRMTTWQPSER